MRLEKKGNFLVTRQAINGKYQSKIVQNACYSNCVYIYILGKGVSSNFFRYSNLPIKQSIRAHFFSHFLQGVS